jgi:hypothetical protein
MFGSSEEKAQALIFAAAVAAHAIVAGRVLGSTYLDTVEKPEGRRAIVKAAFDLAEAFLAEAERRVAIR